MLDEDAKIPGSLSDDMLSNWVGLNLVRTSFGRNPVYLPIVTHFTNKAFELLTKVSVMFANSSHEILLEAHLGYLSCLSIDAKSRPPRCLPHAFCEWNVWNSTIGPAYGLPEQSKMNVIPSGDVSSNFTSLSYFIWECD